MTFDEVALMAMELPERGARSATIGMRRDDNEGPARRWAADAAGDYAFGPTPEDALQALGVLLAEKLRVRLARAEAKAQQTRAAIPVSLLPGTESKG